MGQKTLVALLVISGSLFFAGCSKENDGRMTEKANIEGEAQAQGQRKAEALRALEMETDLTKRQRFYQGLSGTFNGTIKSVQSSGDPIELNVRFNFIPSLPPYKSERSRATEEVIFDLNNLYFTVEVLHWDPKDAPIVFDCVFENVKPDLTKGTINLAKDGCSSIFSIFLFEPDTTVPAPDLSSVSQRLASEILAGQKDKIEELKGIRQSTKTPSVFQLSLKR